MRTRFSYPAIHSLYPQYGTPCYIFPESVPPGFSTDVYGLQYHIRFEQSFLLYPDLKVILLFVAILICLFILFMIDNVADEFINEIPKLAYEFGFFPWLITSFMSGFMIILKICFGTIRIFHRSIMNG